MLGVTVTEKPLLWDNELFGTFKLDPCSFTNFDVINLKPPPKCTRHFSVWIEKWEHAKNPHTRTSCP